MELIKFIVELRYKKPHKLFTVYDELYTALVGREATEKAPVLTPGFGLTVEDKSMRILVDPERTVVDLEYVPNVGYCLDTLAHIFRRINELAPLPLIARMGTRNFWIKPTQMELGQLVLRYKEKFLKQFPLVENAVDVRFAFVLEDEDYRANISFGPIEKATLQHILFSKPPQLPEVLSLLDVDYFILKELEYSEKELRDFIRRAYNFALRKSADVETLIMEIDR